MKYEKKPNRRKDIKIDVCLLEPSLKSHIQLTKSNIRYEYKRNALMISYPNLGIFSEMRINNVNIK